MDETTLHPQLARVAARYDLIWVDLDDGRIEEAQAIEQINDLVAVDDQGVTWHISASTGNWERRSRDGSWVADTPPHYGLDLPRASVASGGADIGISQLVYDDVPVEPSGNVGRTWSAQQVSSPLQAILSWFKAMLSRLPSSSWPNWAPRPWMLLASAAIGYVVYFIAQRVLGS